MSANPRLPKIPSGFSPILLLVATLLAATAGIFISSQYRPVRKNPAPIPTPSPVSETSPTPDLAANWKTFTNNKFQYSLGYPKDWFIHSETTSNSEINTAILANYPADNVGGSKTANSNDSDTKLAIRLEITYTKLDGVDARFSEKEKRENSQLNPSSDLHIANLFTNRLYGSNTEGEHFVSYTASPELDKYLSIHIYVKGVIVSDKINELENAPEWRDLNLIFSSVKFLDTTSIDSGLGKFCGGIAGVTCPAGYRCKLDGDYPDAGGKCVKTSP